MCYTRNISHVVETLRPRVDGSRFRGELNWRECGRKRPHDGHAVLVVALPVVGLLARRAVGASDAEERCHTATANGCLLTK